MEKDLQRTRSLLKKVHGAKIIFLGMLKKLENYWMRYIKLKGDYIKKLIKFGRHFFFFSKTDFSNPTMGSIKLISLEVEFKERYDWSWFQKVNPKLLY